LVSKWGEDISYNQLSNTLQIFNVISYQHHPMEKCHVVLIEKEWVMRETLVFSLVKVVIIYLVVKLEPVRVMEGGVVAMLCVSINNNSSSIKTGDLI